MSDIFREVDEDLRRDQMTAVWKSYAPYIIAGAILVVLITAGAVAWRSMKQSNAEEYSEKFLAVERMGTAQADGAYKSLAEDSNAGYQTLSTFRRAALLANTGRIAEAIQAYEQFAQESDDELWSELAKLQSARLLLGGVSYEDINARLEPLIRDDGPWRVSARELLAFAALQNGDAQKARALMEANMKDPGLSAGVRNRTQQMLASLPAQTMPKE